MILNDTEEQPLYQEMGKRMKLNNYKRNRIVNILSRNEENNEV